MLPTLVNEPGEYPKPDQDVISREVLLLKQERKENSLPITLPLHLAMLFCSLPGQVHHLNRWLTEYFVGHVDIFHMYAELENDEHTEMQLNFQD